MGFVSVAFASALLEAGDAARASLVVDEALKIRRMSLGGNMFDPPQLGAFLSLRTLRMRIRGRQDPDNVSAALITEWPLAAAAEPNHPARVEMAALRSAVMPALRDAPPPAK